MDARFLPLVPRRRLEAGRPRVRRVEGARLLVVRSGDRTCAFVDRCPHRGRSLADGEVDGDSIWCPGHGFRYDLVTGERLQPPVSGGREERLTLLEVREVDGMIGIDVPRGAALTELLDDEVSRRDVRRAKAREDAEG